MRLHGRKSFHCSSLPPLTNHGRRIRFMHPSARATTIRSSRNLDAIEKRRRGVVLVVKVSFPLHSHPREYNNYRNKNKTSFNLLPPPIPLRNHHHFTILSTERPTTSYPSRRSIHRYGQTLALSIMRINYNDHS